MGRASYALAVTVSLLGSRAAQANDTVTFTYDALGRLTTTSISGGPNSGVTTGTAFDPAGNRASHAVSGAASSLRAPATPQAQTQAAQPPQHVPVFVLRDK